MKLRESTRTAQLDEFEWVLMSGCTDKQALMRHLWHQDGEARGECMEAYRLFKAGEDAAARAIVDALLARGPRE